MKTPEEILRKPKYRSLSQLVLICEAMEEYSREQVVIVLAKSGQELKTKLEHNAKGWLECAEEKTKMKEENERLKKEVSELKKLMTW